MIDVMIEAVKSVKSILDGGVHTTKSKGYADFVTDADIAVQEKITAVLQKNYPDCRMVSEENGLTEVTDLPTFILDPIDGTTNFSYKMGFSAVSLGYSENKKVISAVVFEPVRKEIFYAEENKGAYLNDKKIKVNGADKLKDCLIAIGTSPYERRGIEKRFQMFEKIFKNCLDIRRTGSAALDLCYTACGRLDGFLERGLKVWDFAAGMLIVKEAGGAVTDYKGNEAALNTHSDIVAGNININKELIRIIGENYAD